MRIRKSIKLLLNLGNFSNVTLDSEVTKDTEVDGDLAGKSFEQIDQEMNEMLVQSLKEQHEALNELPDSTFKYGR